MLFSPKKHQGFTLLELVITMAVIGILVVLGLPLFMGTIAKGHDARRKQDIKQIQIALQAFYADHGRYPIEYKTPPVTSYDNPPWIVDTGTEHFLFSPIYIPQLPVDPKNNGSFIPGDQSTFSYFSYQYFTDSSGSCYVLSARMENGNDPDAQKNLPISANGLCPPQFGGGIFWAGSPY